MVVWQNSFDGTPGTNITVANSANHGDPIDSLRNSPPANSVRYGDRAWLGASSMRLGTPDAGTHGDVWIYFPTVNNYSISFYLYLTEGGWVRFRDANNLAELYIATASASFIAGQSLAPAIVSQLFDRWVRVEAIVSSTQLAARLYWTDPHSTGTPDHSVTSARAGGTVGGLFVQGGTGENVYVDQVQVGEGEWLGPWPTHQSLSASATLPLAATAEVDSEPIGDNIVAGATLPLAGGAQISRNGRTSASAGLGLAASTQIVRHARMDASGAIGELSAPPVDITREGRFAAGATLPLTGGAGLRSQFRPTFPPMITTELLLGSEWVDVSGDVLAREPVQITRGRADEAATADPSSLSLLLNNRDGRYSPHNPMSPYYGLIGKNTPLRVRVGPLPDVPDLELADTFDRTVSGGWGTSDTGHTWIGSTTGASVSGGAAHHQVDGLGGGNARVNATDLGHQDADVLLSVSTDTAPQGRVPGAVFSEVDLRADAEGRISAFIGFRVDTGYAGGLRVTTSISATVDGLSYSLAPLNYIVGLAYQPGEWLRVRVRTEGSNVRVRVWPEGAPEPEYWHSQGHIPSTGSEATGFAVHSRASQNAMDTPWPVTVSYRDLQVRPVIPTNLNEVSRFIGEVSEWPARWDVSDSDVWVPITASGIRRRLGQGNKPLRSVMRRAVAANYPMAYWPLEDGARTREATSAAEGGSPLRTVGFAYQEDDSLPVSGPLPTLTANASMSVQSVASEGTDSGWEVTFMYRLEEPNDPYEEDQRFLSVQTTTFNIDLSLYYSSGRPAMRRVVVDGGGLELHNAASFVDGGDVTFFGAWRRFRLFVLRTGTSSEARFDRFNEDDENWGGSFAFNAVPGRVTGISTAFGSGLEGMSIGHLSVWGAPQATAYFEAHPGYDREDARQRISRVSSGMGIPVEIDGAAGERLGVEQRGTYLEVIDAAHEADFGAPGESRSTLGLTYRGRDALYHAEPALVLDYMGGEISPPMEPTDDDQALRNDIEVTRTDGSSAQVEDTDGPLGVTRVGRYDHSVTLNLATDAQAEHHAGWRLHLGTVDELRWPMIHLNLANPRLSARVEDVLGLDVGDRIRILNPPPWTQAAHLDLIVQGYAERLNLFTWEIELACTPASPWQPAQITNGSAPPDSPMRADTAGANLPFNINASTTSVVVQTNRGPAWVTSEDNPDSFPFNVMIGGEIMRVTAVTGSGPVQTFTVERAINGIAKPHPFESPVRLAHPAVVAL